MKIKITGIDTLFFKDGKPFSMSEETWADGIFPPSPSVFYGALRTAYFSQHPEEIAKANTESDPTKGLEIKSIYFGAAGQYMLPLPFDCAGLMNSDGKEFLRLKLQKKAPGVTASNSGDYYLSASQEVKKAEDGLISMSEMKRLLNNSERGQYSSISEFITIEPKIGIGLDRRSGTVSHGKLYRVGQRRLSPIRKKGQNSDFPFEFIIDFEGIKLPESGVFKLGGEGKLVSYEISDHNFDIPECQETGLYRIYLLTPAIFTEGWRPDFNSSLLSPYKFELLTHAMGKPLNLGGFDMKKRVPKKMYKAVPAGTVYFAKSDAPAKDISRLNFMSISDYSSKEGFGRIIVNGVNL